jgi:hypothetical protein
MSNFDASIYDSVPAPHEGDFPERFMFNNPGENIAGTLVDVRKHTSDKYEPCLVHDIEVAPGQRYSVFVTTTSQRRLANAKRPVPGQQIRWTFTGFEGQAKVFTLDVAANGSAPAATPAPAPTAPAAPAAPAWGGAAPEQAAPAAPPAWG